MTDRCVPARTRLLLLTGVCVAALGLAACGDDDDDAAVTTEAPATTTDTGATGAESSTDVTELREQFTAGLLEAAAEDQDLTQAQSDCLRERLDEEITDEMLQEANESGGLTPEMTQVALETGAACAQE